MLELSVSPEHSIGTRCWSLILGMPLPQVIHIIRQQVEEIKNVTLVYSDQNPLDKDICLYLSQDGIALVFDCSTQRLRTIEIYDVSKVMLIYSNRTFCSPQIQPTLDLVYQTFGATVPGVYNSDQNLLAINYRGISFHFNLASRLLHSQQFGLESIQVRQSSPSPVVSNISIFSGDNLNTSPVPVIPTKFLSGAVHAARVEALWTKERLQGLAFYLDREYTNITSSISETQAQEVVLKKVLFNDKLQDVLSALGSPSKIFYKDEDKMRIHSMKKTMHTRKQSDFFCNYFSLGVDILCDAKTSRVKKFILHTNFPGHYNFDIYARCPFSIRMTRGGVGQSEGSTLQINPCTRWNEIEGFVGQPREELAILNRGSTNTTNPFSPTFCCGFQDIIFEIMHNQHIGSITLYLSS
ncbi:hypothetical protein LOD99_5167 [Oopsacas minuta]|uniref:Uncharacterized protein n=1 Tax=Oopsacas minuta TaxID=111878 RepID=A0AAV7JSQ0_9METZ|nr:hypothetical protein LOD99_5167 [Oopsacas minuta]